MASQRNDTMGNIKSDSVGSIVAFEGHPETISTQLRLLPTSPQILILPGVQCYMPTEEEDKVFEAHAFIRDAHNALLNRNKTAHEFLKGATESCKRLVFMNGGTPSAQALCLRAIMRHDTQGDDLEADVKFNFLVKEGLGGLDAQAKKWDTERFCTFTAGAVEQRSSSLPAQHFDSSTQMYELVGDEFQEDPITRAMRAAEALDRETANLQPSNDIDLTVSSRPRSMSLPMYGYSDNFGDAAPFFVFGAPNRRRGSSDASLEESADDDPFPPTTPRFSITHYDDINKQLTPTPMHDNIYSPSCVGESYRLSYQAPTFTDALPSSRSETFDVRSSAEVVFGEASIVDVRTTCGKGPVTRVRSLDRMYSSVPKYGDLGVPLDNPTDEEIESALRPRPRSCMVVTNERDSAKRLSIIEGPRTVVVKPRQASLVSLSPVPSVKKRKPQRLSYVDRGTDAGPFVERAEPFVPVLPVIEDLSIFFKDEVSDALLDKVIRGYKEGVYPLLKESGIEADVDTTSFGLPSTPKSNTANSIKESPRGTVVGEPTVASLATEADEYDPFAYVQNSWPIKESAKNASVMKIQRPPTPEKTPAPSLSERNDSFYDFHISSGQTAVAVQNALRSILGVYFPPENQGYKQFSFSLLPELEGLWKPIFREAEPGSPRTTKRRMDQILAIGSQKDVGKDYSLAIAGLLDKLGSKNSGMSRSGRLDFRYLLANAMQAFTAQPLANQTSDNPFNNSYLLASLIIPHLETYLALHTEVRYLLLEYPPEHLSTILALQKLVGVDLMKVAQIVDSKTGDLGAFKHIRGASFSSITEKTNPLGKPVGTHSSASADVSVSKANFLLTSSASDSEIATFVATVRKILMEVSQFYTPEEPPQPTLTKKHSGKRPKPPPLTSTFSPFPKTTGPQSPKSPMTPSIIPTPLVSPALSTFAKSTVETIKTSKSTRSVKSRKSKSTRRRPPTADGGESIMTYDYDPAEDSDYDFEERRLMPIFLQKPSRLQKPNSRKALKFLGLA